MKKCIESEYKEINQRIKEGLGLDKIKIKSKQNMTKQIKLKGIEKKRTKKKEKTKEEHSTV